MVNVLISFSSILQKQNIFENDEVIWMFQIARLKNHPDTYTAEGRAADKLFSPFSKQYPYHYYQNSRTD